jgi:hypothetical protein
VERLIWCAKIGQMILEICCKSPSDLMKVIEKDLDFDEFEEFESSLRV